MKFKQGVRLQMSMGEGGRGKEGREGGREGGMEGRREGWREVGERKSLLTGLSSVQD